MEGHEFEMLKGAEQTLTSEKPILLIEIEQRHHQINMIDSIFEWLRQRGYESVFIDKEERKLKSLNKFNLHDSQKYSLINTKYYINNFIFYPEDKKESLKLFLDQKLRTEHHLFG